MSTERALALIDKICGPPDEAAKRTVEVINAHAAALAWVRGVTGTRPAPRLVAERLRAADARLRTGEDDRDPAIALIEIAIDTLAELRCGTS